jgi:putative ABC transport system permease protein
MLSKIALASSWRRRSILMLVVVTIALSVFLMSGVLQLKQNIRNSFDRSVSGTDLVVGARGGDLALVLYSIFHIGQATQTISWKSVDLISNNKAVDWAVPLALGDSHKGYRVVGTDVSFFSHFKVGRDEALGWSDGQAFSGLFDVVIGAEVAKKLNYSIGDSLTLSHGTGKNSFSEHDDLPFKVSGILKPTGTPVDRSLYVSLAAIEAIHVGWKSGTRMPGEHHSAQELAAMDLTPKEVTALLVGMKSSLGTFSFQRTINRYSGEPLQAVLPGVALQQLWEVMRSVENALLILSVCVILSGMVGMIAVLLATLAARKREIAIFRAVGARPRHIMALLMVESTALALIGSVLGWGASLAVLTGLSPWLSENYGLYLGNLFGHDALIQGGLIIVAVTLAGTVLGMVPGVQAYRQSAHDGLIIKS